MENQEEKIVAAKNEENAKVSAVQPVQNEKSENEPPPAVIEKPIIPHVTLRHSYKEGNRLLSWFLKNFFFLEVKPFILPLGRPFVPLRSN